MSLYRISVGVLLSAFFMLSCKEKTLFTEVDAFEAGLNFENRLTETDAENVMTYEYFYNGGGVAVADFNNDGFADVYLSGNQVANKLFLNLGKWNFKDVTQTAEIKEKQGWKTGVTAADVNGDGLMDLYLSYSGNSKKEGHAEPVIPNYEGRSNALFINQGNNADGVPVFKEMAKEYGIADPGNSMNDSTTHRLFVNISRSRFFSCVKLHASKKLCFPISSTSLPTPPPTYCSVL